MKKLWLAAAAASVLIAGRDSVQSQTLNNTTDVPCIVSNTACTTGDFEHATLHNAMPYSLTTVLVDGFYQPGDHGGGTFISLGTTSCHTNGGSILKDGNGWCYQRVNSTYGPKEFGAKGISQGGADDTTALQSWFDANQPHIGDADTYKVVAPLSCNKDTTIQGPANLTGSGTTPLFGIQANTGSWGTGTAVIEAQKFCRLNGIAVDANGLTDGVDIYGERVAIDGFSAISNGFPYNVNCIGSSAAQAGLQIKNAELSKSNSDNLHLSGCPNVRVIGDIVTGSGTGGTGKGIVFGGDDITVADSVIEQSASTGLDLTGASKVSVTGNFFDDNGKGQGGGAAIEIDNTVAASICGNHLEGNGEYSPTPAQVYFAGSNDGIDFCGNVYDDENENGDVTIKPSYVYDADPGTVLTQQPPSREPGTPNDWDFFAECAADPVAASGPIECARPDKRLYACKFEPRNRRTACRRDGYRQFKFCSHPESEHMHGRSGRREWRGWSRYRQCRTELNLFLFHACAVLGRNTERRTELHGVALADAYLHQDGWRKLQYFHPDGCLCRRFVRL